MAIVYNKNMGGIDGHDYLRSSILASFALESGGTIRRTLESTHVW